MNKKFTAWKKNRKLGDVYGGRRWVKRADNIFNRLHNLKSPTPYDDLPILIQDNTSRDFFFPISANEALMAVKALPEEDYDGVTHIWCRKIKKTDYDNNEMPWASYICGSGVRVIVLYPWPKSLKLKWDKKPSNRFLNDMKRYGIPVIKRGKKWVMSPTVSQLRKMYIEYLVYHEIGHHVDYYNRHWSKANVRQREDFADQYAFHKTSIARSVFNRLQQSEFPGPRI